MDEITSPLDRLKKIFDSSMFQMNILAAIIADEDVAEASRYRGNKHEFTLLPSPIVKS